MALDDRPPEHAAKAAEDLVAEIGRHPLDRVGTERAGRRHRMGDLPPHRERVGVEERLHHARRRRSDDRRDVETWSIGHLVVELSGNRGIERRQ